METQRPLFSDANAVSDLGAGQGAARAILRVIVKGLFGHFNYVLPDADRIADLSKVFILYGDNGSGKTTILRALFHLLSSANDRGHRNALASIPFERIEIHVSGGGWIAAYRESESMDSYSVEGELDNQRLRVRFDRRTEQKFGSEEEKEFFLSFLKTIDQTLYLLSADRTMMSDVLPQVGAEPFERARYLEQRIAHSVQYATRAEALDHMQLAAPLQQAIQLANDGIRRQVIQANTRGAENVNAIYTEIIRRIAGSPNAAGETARHDSKQLAETLQELAARNARYAKFQFTSPLQVDEILAVLQRVDSGTAVLIANVLEPYINGTTARLDALDRLQKTTAGLVENLNSFYARKSVSFDVTEGLKIRQSDGSPLDPSLLSSGERQLLLMFCHIVLPRRGQGIFIIDEPELSLNVKWQRRLIGTLQEMVQGANVQLIFATHSIEFLSQHLDHVVELKSTDQLLFKAPALGENSDSADNS